MEAATDNYEMAFSEYLTATAGQRFTEPIEFELVVLDFDNIILGIDEGTVDFVFANPGIYSCIGVERGAQPLATKISRYSTRSRVYDLDVFGGVIFAKADNKAINDLNDLRDKVIAAGDIASIMGGQTQIYEMRRAGLDYLMDPKQMIFTHDEFNIVRGVLDGSYDVGFVRTYMIEQTKHLNGTEIDKDIFKVLNPRFYELESGDLFPFIHSTDIFPEWAFSAIPHVHYSVSKEVGDALVAIKEHSLSHEKLIEEGLWETFRCDTSEALAELAWKAAKKGHMAGFRPPRSYFNVRNMHEEEGFLRKDKEGNWKCSHAKNLYDGLVCPQEHYKLPQSEFGMSCSHMNLTCPKGADCFCRPCIKAFEVDVFEWTDDLAAKSLSDGFLHPPGCAKMSVCGAVQQTKTITFRIVDNQKRKNPIVEAKMHTAARSKDIPVKKISDYIYEIDDVEYETGVSLLEVFFDGVQIPESPVRMTVIDRDCDADFPGQNKDNEYNGGCVCRGGTLDILGKCVESMIIAITLSAVSVFIVTIVGYIYLRYRTKKADEIWQVCIQDLQFDDPVQIIGEGSFGVVVLAEFRGTKCALKQAIRNRKNRTGTKSRAMSSALRNSSGNADTVDQFVPDGKAEDEVISLETTDDIEMAFTGKNDETGLRSSEVQTSVGIHFLESRRGQKWWNSIWASTKDDHTERFRQAIFGSGVVSRSSRSVSAYLLPWFSEAAKAREEFVSLHLRSFNCHVAPEPNSICFILLGHQMAEMRVLSRLRHPVSSKLVGKMLEL